MFYLMLKSFVAHTLAEFGLIFVRLAIRIAGSGFVELELDDY